MCPGVPLVLVFAGLGVLPDSGFREPPARMLDVPRLQEGVEGRVTRPDGEPIVGAFVQARSLDDPAPPIPEIAIVTDEDGRYAWPLEPGRYQISVSSDGYRSARKSVSFRAGEVKTLDFVLQPLETSGDRCSSARRSR
jgi:hypothetical protein